MKLKYANDGNVINTAQINEIYVGLDAVDGYTVMIQMINGAKIVASKNHKTERIAQDHMSQLVRKFSLP